MKRLDVRVFGIYEVAPPLDFASGTANWPRNFATDFYTMFEDLNFPLA